MDGLDGLDGLKTKIRILKGIEATKQAAQSFAKLGAALATAASLIACAAQQQRAVNDAYASGQLAKSEAVKACAQSQRVASCMLGVAVAFGGGNSDSVPVVQSDLSAILNSSVLGTGLGVIGNIRASDNAAKVAIAQTGASVAIAQSGDARQVATMQAATGANVNIATGGFSAVAGVAGVGLVELGSAASAASAASVQNSQAWAGALAALPPTTQITAGGSITQSGRDTDQSTTGRNRITGDGNETERQVSCVAQGGNGAPATGGNQSASGGTSPVTAGYNPLITAGDGAAGTNNCGGG